MDNLHAERAARSPTTLSNEVRATIRAELARRGRTQTALADAVGMSQVAMSRRLLGQTPIDLDDLEGIAAFLQMPVSALLPVEASA